jgi:hypothetical protein
MAVAAQPAVADRRQVESDARELIVEARRQIELATKLAPIGNAATIEELNEIADELRDLIK